MFATTHARYWQDLTEKADKIKCKITLLGSNQFKVEHPSTKTEAVISFKDERNIWNEIHNLLLGIEFGKNCIKPKAKKHSRVAQR